MQPAPLRELMDDYAARTNLPAGWDSLEMNKLEAERWLRQQRAAQARSGSTVTPARPEEAATTAAQPTRRSQRGRVSV